MRRNLLLAAGLVAVIAFAMVPVAASAGGCGCKGGPAMEEGGHKMHHGPGHKKDHKFWKCPKASAELALTAEQVKRLEGIDEAAGKKLEALKAEIKELKQAKREAMKGYPVDQKKVNGLVKKIGELKLKKMEIKTGMKLEAIGVLTKDQKLKLDGLHEKMMKMHEGKGGDEGCGCKHKEGGCRHHGEPAAFGADQAQGCDCGPDCKCGPGCNCQNGGECNCGPDCPCKADGACNCGGGEGCGCKGEGKCGAEKPAELPVK